MLDGLDRKVEDFSKGFPGTLISVHHLRHSGIYGWPYSKEMVQNRLEILGEQIEAFKVKLLPLVSSPRFSRGDFDGSGTADLTDAILILDWKFRGGSMLEGRPVCEDAGDVNDDGQLDQTDAINLLVYLYLGGSPPAAPYPEAGSDPTADDLGCDAPAPTG